MFIGSYQLGDRVPLVVLCDELPDEAPIALIYAAADTVAMYSTPLSQPDEFRAALLFERAIHLDGRFAAGQYSVLYTWTVGGDARAKQHTYRIIPGGHADGAVISLYPFHKPQAEFLLQHTDAGKLLKGRNPTI